MEKITLNQLKAIIKKGENKTVRLVPSKMSPVGMWGVWHDIQTESLSMEDLNKIINSFSYYNCTTETGLRIHYYIV